MGLILLLLTPFVIESRLEKYGYASLALSAMILIPFFILAAIYIYFWVKSDNKNPETERWLAIQEERNNILREHNSIIERKSYYNTRI